jgi:hypothetical protein
MHFFLIMAVFLLLNLLFVIVCGCGTLWWYFPRGCLLGGGHEIDGGMAE